ncbi:MAG TPA: exodeoxyribonuclease VII large subunit [Planctomycetota bacterium]|nr:exodeoxyribonuclease VII large subunit [Planctomycetota bacterium]
MTRRSGNSDGRFEPTGERHVYTVTEITRAVKTTLEGTFGRVWVTGEVSNLRRPQSGHVYLTLKDESCQLSAVMFRGVASRVRFDLTDGMQVVVGGELTVYEARGNYQVIITSLEPRGVGALELAFKQLVEKLRREGLFDDEHKVPIPAFPRHIAVVTSPTGAAIRDILQVTFRRFPGMHVTIYPVRVQGEEAAREIAGGIRELNRIGGFDVIITGRGGGSLEDLWAFNEEVVARAIYASEIPVVSAVGHEIDVTISDMVADLRAATPTAAAELVVPRRADLEATLLDAARRLRHALAGRGVTARAMLNTLRVRVGPARLRGHLAQLIQRTDDLGTRLGVALRGLIRHFTARLAGTGGKLDSLSPLRVLERGYSITRADGTVLRDAGETAPGDRINTILFRGRITSRVESVETSDGQEKENR